jgi:3D (Asp-Asp-Asp) domain-containing protein
MKKTILSLAAMAAMSGVLGTQASAQDVKVKDGDTLWGLSQTYQVTVDDIKSWNNLNSDTIIAGNVLKVSNEEYYTIKKGDTLWNIANSFGVTVNELQDWNGIEGEIIHPGNQIVVLGNAAKPSTTTAAAPAPAPEKAKEEAAPVQEKAPAAAPAPSVQAAATPSSSNEGSGTAAKEFTVSATAYTAHFEGSTGITATGIDLRSNPDAKVIAVDPSVIPLGSKVHVEGYGTAIAGDTGGAIKGNKIDVFIPNEQDALNWGRKNVTIKVYE